VLEFSIITISSFVTVLNEFVKTFSNIVFKKDISRIIPILSVIFGIALGIAGYYIPNVEMGNNIIEAIFIGISAGSAATGVNQISKQLNKNQNNTSGNIEIDLGQFIDDQLTTADPVCDIQEEKETNDE
jgi:formate-dependent nitrite reductase membrane component NrfD